MPRPLRPARTTLRAFILASSLVLLGSLPTTAPAAAQAQADQPFRSDRLSVEVVGAGPDVVLIPGFASSREVWRPLAERLKATHRVHLVQLAGFAGEPWAGEGPFLEPMLAELQRYVDQQGLSRPAVIGHSMGGLAALMLAERSPEAVGRVMTVDSLPFFSALYGPQATPETARPFAEQAAAAMLTPDDAAFRTAQARSAAGLARDPAARTAMVEWSAASDRRALAAAIREVMTTDARPRLGSIRVPVWAVYAADGDGGAPPEVADSLWAREYAGLPGVRLERVDDARHFIMADQPERFAELVTEFLR